VSEPNPTDILGLMRLNAHSFDDEQVRLFLELPPQEQRELLFRMSFQTNAILRQLHDKIEPGRADIQSMPDAPRKN